MKKLNQSKNKEEGGGLVFSSYCGDCVTCGNRNRDEQHRFQKHPNSSRMKVNNQTLIDASMNEQIKEDEIVEKALSNKKLP
jgi:hypothetical protein